MIYTPNIQPLLIKPLLRHLLYVGQFDIIESVSTTERCSSARNLVNKLFGVYVHVETQT